MTFRSKLNIAFVCAGVLPLILLGTLMMNRMVAQYVSDRRNDLQHASRVQVDALDQLFMENSVAMQTIAASLEVNYYLEYFRRHSNALKGSQYWTYFDQAAVYIRTLAEMQSRQIKNIVVLPLNPMIQGIAANGMDNEAPFARDYEAWAVYSDAVEKDGRYVWSIIAPDEMPSPLPGVIRQSEYYIFQSALIYGGYDFSPCGVVIIQFNERYFRTHIQSTLGNQDALYAVVSGDGHLVFHSNTRLNGCRLDDPELSKLLMSGAIGAGGTVAYQHGEYIPAGGGLNIPGWYMLSLTPIESLSPEAWLYVIPIVMFMLLGVFIAIVISLLFSRSLYTPIKELRDTLDEAQTNLDMRLPETRKDEFGILYRSTNSFMQRIQALIAQVRQEHQLKNEANMNVLRAQVNPHFLYNTLNIIKCLADMKDFESIQRTVVSLISLLRASIGDTRELIMVPEEMKLVSDYLTIQHLRADFTFRFEQQMQPELNDCKIQKFILQPLVENCLVHAFPSMKNVSDTYTVLIRGWLSEGNVVIEVIDNGRGLSGHKLDELNEELNQVPKSLKFGHVGLQNVNVRIKLMFGEQYGLSIAPRESGGTTVRMVYPVPIE